MFRLGHLSGEFFQHTSDVTKCCDICFASSDPHDGTLLCDWPLWAGEEEEEPEGGEVADVKSNNLHLIGGEKNDLELNL